ncbi:MAG: hypothetical protein GX847_10455, partial [Clostridiales bacterium]|nr:hypothetical protein [Clostridiales bacterium]
MKKLIISLLMLPVLFLTMISARANSGPTYMYASPGLEMAVDAGCPIAVAHEDLTLDFSAGTWGDWSPQAEITASYTMTNPSDGDVSVSMAFPFVTRLSSPDPGVSSVSVDGEAAAFDIYYGNGITDEADLSALNLSDVLSNVLLEAPKEPADGFLYTVTVDTSALPAETERIYVRLRFGPQDGVVYIDGFNGMSRDDDGRSEVSAWIYIGRDDRPLTIYAPGGGLKDYSLDAYASHDSDTPLSNISLDVTQSTVSFRGFLEDCLWADGANAEGPGSLLDENYYWALLQEANSGSYGDMYGNFIPAAELLHATGFKDRLAMAVYTVEFLKGETKNITVQCALEGTMQRPSGYSMENAAYTYTYLSNPAKEWASFGTLSLTVIPPENLPLSASVPELALDDHGHYTAKLHGLPESNISIT